MAFGYATRRELDALARRVDQMDAGGTRGMGGVTVQVGNLIADVTELRVKLEGHDRHHQQEAEERASDRIGARRYVITTTIAAVGILLAVVADILSHVH